MADGNGVGRKAMICWLRYLMYAHGAGLVLGLLSFVPVLEGMCATVSWVVTLAVVVILFRLGNWESGYRRAAVYMALGFAIQLCNYSFSLLMMGQLTTPELAVQLGVVSGMMMTGASVFSFLALYHMYGTHGRVAPQFAADWRRLFLWTLIAGVSVSVVTAVCAALALSWLAALAALAYSLATFAFETLRLVWLRNLVLALSSEN